MSQPVMSLRVVALALAALLSLSALPALARDIPAAPASPATAIPGLSAQHLDPAFWMERIGHRDRVLLQPDQVAQQNVRMLDDDPAIHDIEGLSGTLERTQVEGWIRALSAPPTRTLYDETGKAGTQRQMERLVTSLALAQIPQTQVTRHGMLVQRADVRTFPTRLRVFHSPGDTDLDRFQETALFPGTPVVIAHASRDRAWLFVVSATYAGWVEARHVAQGDKRAIFEYARRAPYVVVTGATARTAFTPSRPEVSSLQLEMGVRVPVLVDWPPDAPVNGQHPLASHVIELPTRDADGMLAFAPALLPRSADVAPGSLPMTSQAIVAQSFKFLGERYGWGHDYNARDCSGFVGEVYRSFGVLMPRNTGAQATSPALAGVALTADDDHARRVALLRATRVGDLVYIPGHVMLVIGHVDGAPYVIHDVAGMTHRVADGSIVRTPLNGVVVTPLLPMLGGDGRDIADHVTAIRRMAP